MKRTVILWVIIGFLVSGPISGLEIGGTLRNGTGVSSGATVTFSQTDKVGVWLLQEFGELMRLAAQGSYTFSLEIPYLFDLDYLEVSGEAPRLLGEASLVTWSIGRFALSDFTGKVLSHTIDGGFVEMRFPFVSFSAGVGYTGLLLKPVSSVILSLNDVLDKSNVAVYFASPRIVGYAELTFPELLFRQSLSISIALQQELRAAETLVGEGDVEESTEKGGPVHTQYYSLGLSGPIYGPSYYEAFFVLQTGTTLSYMSDAASSTGFSYQKTPMLAFLGGGSAQLYLERLLYSVLDLRFVCASGDADYVGFLEGNSQAEATMFTPVTNAPMALVFSPLAGNISAVELSYSLKPLSWTQVAALGNIQSLVRAVVFLRTIAGVISVPGVSTDSVARYLGTELDVVLNARPFSDLGVAVTGGLFLPNNAAGGALAPDVWPVTASVRFDLFFSF